MKFKYWALSGFLAVGMAAQGDKGVEKPRFDVIVKEDEGYVDFWIEGQGIVGCYELPVRKGVRDCEGDLDCQEKNGGDGGLD